MNYYGQLDLTRLDNLINEHPEALRKVQFKDGEHLLLNIEVREKPQADQYGNVAYIKNYNKGESTYLADLKPSKQQERDQFAFMEKFK